MSDFFTKLATRSIGWEIDITPRLRSRFEPANQNLLPASANSDELFGAPATIRSPRTEASRPIAATMAGREDAVTESRMIAPGGISAMGRGVSPGLADELSDTELDAGDSSGAIPPAPPQQEVPDISTFPPELSEGSSSAGQETAGRRSDLPSSAAARRPEAAGQTGRAIADVQESAFIAAPVIAREVESGDPADEARSADLVDATERRPHIDNDGVVETLGQIGPPAWQQPARRPRRDTGTEQSLAWAETPPPPQQTTIEVTIGRIDVRAATPPQQTASRPAQASAIVRLQDYLKQHRQKSGR